MGLGGSGGGRKDSDENDEETGIAPEQTTLIDPAEDEDSSDDHTGTAAAGAAGAGAGAGAGVGTGPPPGTGNDRVPSGEDDDEGEENREAEDGENTETSEDAEDSRFEDATESSDPSENQSPEQSSEENEETEPQEAELVVYTDAWDATGWGIEPDLKHLEVEFGIAFDLTYELLSPREIEQSDMDSAIGRYEMPYGQIDCLPESTALSTTALQVAKDQNQNLFRDYLRRLRISALVEGRDIEDRNFLTDVAGRIGYDTDSFLERWGEPEEIDECEATPLMWATIGDLEIPWSGNIDYEFAWTVFVDRAVPPAGIPLSLPGFVSEHEPTTTAEVAETFELPYDEAFGQLRQHPDIEPVDYGPGTFWVKRGGASQTER